MDPIRKIVIVGGGTSGWLAASMLSHHLDRTAYRIELVESAEIGTIGIGESTVPPFVGLIRRLGIDEQDFMQATGATCKLGIRFVDWHRQETQYFHPFGVLGSRIANQDFYQCWLKARSLGYKFPLQDFSPCTVMAEYNRFFRPEQARNTPIGGANYALHVDAKRVALYLRGFAEAKGVLRTEGRVVEARQHEDGFISGVILADGRNLDADFFIDCTGFKALLLGGTLAVGFEDWSKWLPCDRAIAVKSRSTAPPHPYTLATARRAGWTWRIPLQDTVGHGYVYASSFCNDADAKTALLSSLNGAAPLEEPRLIPFMTGRRQQIWKHNCLSLGLAAGFVEPLESTSIHLIARGIDFFLRHFPDRACDPALVREYNRRMHADFEEIRDFIVLHYCTTAREDTPFWRHCRSITLPESLQERIDLFRAQGTLREGVDELFRSTSWQSVFEGMGIRPHRHNPLVDNLDDQRMLDGLATARRAIRGMVEALPTHEEFLQDPR